MKGKRYPEVRVLGKISKNSNVSNTNWSTFLSEDLNVAYNNFVDEHSRLYNHSFPLKISKGTELLNKPSSP